MPDFGEELLITANEILKLLRIMAEPTLAEQDKEGRALLRQTVGKSAAKAAAVMLMDGRRSQAEIKQLAKVDAGDLSKMLKALRNASLLAVDDKPKLRIHIPSNFFEKAPL